MSDACCCAAASTGNFPPSRLGTQVAHRLITQRPTVEGLAGLPVRLHIRQGSISGKLGALLQGVGIIALVPQKIRSVSASAVAMVCAG